MDSFFKVGAGHSDESSASDLEAKLDSNISSIKDSTCKVQLLTQTWGKDSWKEHKTLQQVVCCVAYLFTTDESNTLGSEKELHTTPHNCIVFDCTKRRGSSVFCYGSIAPDLEFKQTLLNKLQKRRPFLKKPKYRIPNAQMLESCSTALNQCRTSTYLPFGCAFLLLLGKTLFPILQQFLLSLTHRRPSCPSDADLDWIGKFDGALEQNKAIVECNAAPEGLLLYCALGSVAAICYIFARIRAEQWTSIASGCFVSITLGTLRWRSADGSLFGYLFILNPFLMTVGFSLGLMLHEIRGIAMNGLKKAFRAMHHSPACSASRSLTHLLEPEKQPLLQTSENALTDLSVKVGYRRNR